MCPPHLLARPHPGKLGSVDFVLRGHVPSYSNLFPEGEGGNGQEGTLALRLGFLSCYDEHKETGAGLVRAAAPALVMLKRPKTA